MYSIRSIPITNNNQKSFPTSNQIKQKIAQKVAFDWLLPQQSCSYFDIIGRQLIKKTANVLKSTHGLENLRAMLLSIDVHCFSSLVCSVVVSDKDALCRVCENTDKKMLFMLHCVALEGTNRYIYSIVDYICIDCAHNVCATEIRGANDRQDKINSARWLKTFSSLQNNMENRQSISTIELYKLLLLSGNSLGCQVCQLEPFVDMFVQENFAAEQISLLLSKEKTTRLPVTDLFNLSYVKSFLACSCCGTKLENSDIKFGAMSTVYYDTSRVFAVPYYICTNPVCMKIWQNEEYSQTRFRKLLALHQTSMRECYRQSLQSLYCVAPKILGLEHTEFAQSSEKKINEEYISPLLMSVEQDMLNKLFNLDKQQSLANCALKSLQAISKDPCVSKLDSCVKRCLCENCISHNMLLMELLKQFEIVISSDSAASCANLDQVFQEFCDFRKKCVIEPSQVKSHFRCWRDSKNSVCNTLQNSRDQFHNWRLKSKKRNSKKSCTDCADCYADGILDHSQMGEFFDTTCSFLSQMF